MAAESEHPSASPLLSQLHQSLQQLEQVVGQLETDSQQRQQLPPNTLRRLEATTARVADYLSGTGAEPALVDAPHSDRDTTEPTDSDQDWDGIDELLDAFDTPTETAAPTPAPGDRPRPTTARAPSTIAKTQSPLWFVRWVAAGLLGIFIGVGLWIGYPPLSIPPLLTWLNQQFLTPSVSEIREPSTESSGLVGSPVAIEPPSPVATMAEPAVSSARKPYRPGSPPRN